MSSTNKINTAGRSPYCPGDNNSATLPGSAGTTTSSRVFNTLTHTPATSPGKGPTYISNPDVRRAPKRRAGKENQQPPQLGQCKRPKLSRHVAHVGDHSITATEVAEKILADGIDVALADQGSDFLKQYLDTFLGPVAGFVLDPATQAFNAASIVASLESPGRVAQNVNFTTAVNLPRPRRRLVQYTRIMGSRNVKDSDVDINIPEVYQHGVVVPSKIGERVTNVLPWARRSFENMARISLTGLERFDCSMWYAKGIFYSLLRTRLTQALIPVPIPDLINAPVQNILLQDGAEWQAQLAVIQHYNEAGWLVLTEGIDYTKADTLSVHMLAYGSSAFPVDVRDLAVAAQSFRWPYYCILICHTTPILPFPAPQDWDPANMFVWLRQLALARGEEDMLVTGYHTACQLIASEWIGRFGNEPINVARVPGFPPNQEPPAMPQDRPHHWEPAAGDVPAGPGVDHWFFDAPNGMRNGGEGYDMGPLIIPDPNDAIGVAYRAAVAAWERARDIWVNAPPAAGQPDRVPEAYAIAAPIRPAAPVGMVRTAHRDVLWGEALEGVDRVLVDDLPAAPRMGNPERWSNAEWSVLCRRANVYRAMTPFYECNALLDYPLPKDHCVVWRWAGVKRTTPAATAAANHPVFTCALELEALLRLALWQGGILFSASTTVFYNYNLTGSILQQISAGVYANQLLRQFVIEKHMLTRINDVGTNQPLLAAAIRTMVAQLLKVQVPNPFLGIRHWACIQTVPAQEAHSFLARYWPGTPPMQHVMLAFARWLPIFPLEWGITGRGPNVNFTAECSVISRVADQCGWRGEQGSGDYAQRASGARPFRQVAYGPLAVNTI